MEEKNVHADTEKSNKNPIVSANRETTETDDTQSKGKPVELEWCCGINTKIDAIDLSTDDDSNKVAFVANHLVVIQNLQDNGHYPLLGHRNNVTCLAGSRCKRWIVSGDYGPNASVIVWNVENCLALQLLDVCNHQSIASGVASLSFSLDGRTLILLASNSVVTFWQWTEDTPYLYGEQILMNPISMGNCPSITSRKIDQEEVVLITWTNKLVYLHTMIQKELINIDGEIISCEKMYITVEEIVPEEEEIGLLKAGWEFGSSKFISDSETVTYFKKGNGALILTRRLIIKGIEKWKNLKMIKFSERPLTSLDVVSTDKETFIAIADFTGHIRFLSVEMKIIFWLKLPKLNSLCSISFSSCCLRPIGENADGEEATLDPQPFQAPSFTAATNLGCVYVVKEGKLQVIFEGAPEGNLKIIAHPFKELIIVAGNDELRLMDTRNTGKFEIRTKLDGEIVSCLSFNVDGAELVIGCESGNVYHMDTLSLNVLSKLEPSQHSVVEVIYSPSGLYTAAGDTSHAITMWERDNIEKNEWRDMGRYRPHSQDIIQLLFVDEYGIERLLSLAKDRKLVEYAIEDKLKINSQYRIEVDAIPTCLTKYPSGRFEEEFLFTANDKFKLRLFNQSTKLPRRITNSQNYDSPITKLFGRPCGLDVISFTTNTCIGIMELPIDGNPNREYAVLANPSGITGAAAGLSKMITVGPGLISAWNMNYESMKEHRLKGGCGMVPFYKLLENEEFKLLQDVFYFCQLEEQGIETDTVREVNRSISVNKVPDAVRALGWFPSELQIEELLTEIKFSKYHKTQEQTKMVDLDDFIKLYLNHKPVNQISLEEVEEAFNLLSVNGNMNSGELLHVLEYFGEKMSQTEISDCLKNLGQDRFPSHGQINSHDFTEKILKL